MASDDTEQYLTYEARLASFQTKKKRGSTTGGRGNKAPSWPHKKIAPESLAHAGFFFQPNPDNPDNVVCFLCQKNMDGWEEGDNPTEEHLKHSTNCGWAIVTAIEAEMEGYVHEDPGHPDMIAARKATFAGRWPHESKRGWKCKTKQLVDAGWKYTPTPESDDMATCTYCDLALDGWEPGDKPLVEHQKRSPNCAFFALMEQHKATKKASRAKASRASKASRLSTQSVATVASEMPSVADMTAAGLDDTVLTTASTMTQGGKKSRAKKSTTAKGRNTKSKKEEPVEVVEDAPAAETREESPAAPPPTKAKRGKKRGSDAVEDSTMTLSQAPAPKKRNTKTRGSAAVESSVLEPPEDEDMADVPTSKKGGNQKKGRASNTRKASAKKSTPSASWAAPPGQFPDDDEIERQLEAELEQSLTDEDVGMDSDSERSRVQAKAPQEEEPQMQPTPEPARSSANFAMFNPAPAEVDEDAVEDELEALRAEMEVEEPRLAQEVEPEPEPEPVIEPTPEKLHVPKKGTKAGTRKASKQTKAKKVQPPPEPVVEEAPAEMPEPQPEEAPVEILEDEDASMGSTDTVVKASETQAKNTTKRGRGRPSKASRASFESVEDELAEVPAEPVKKPGRGRPPKASAEKKESVPPEEEHAEELPEASVQPTKEPAEQPKKRGRGRPSKASLEAEAREEAPAKAEQPAKRGRGRPPKRSSEAPNTTDPGAQLLAEAEAAEIRQDDDEDDGMELLAGPDSVEDSATGSNAENEPELEAPTSASRQLLEVPSTPGHGTSPSHSARQAALSPSPSPQSSDAENQPPSSVPAASASMKRIALAPIAATPMRSSPSKRNMIAGLQAQTPWSKIDVDQIMGTPMAGSGDKENAGIDRLLRKGKDLTSPEKRMTVEEWIHFNASEAEKLLKHECEDMVSRFEREGTKAMRVLESLIVDE